LESPGIWEHGSLISLSLSGFDRLKFDLQSLSESYIKGNFEIFSGRLYVSICIGNVIVGWCFANLLFKLKVITSVFYIFSLKNHF